MFFADQEDPPSVGGLMVEQEPDVVIAPKPKRVIAVTPDYMDNSSQTELNSILSQNYATSKSTEREDVFGAGPPPPLAMSSSKKDREVYA